MPYETRTLEREDSFAVVTLNRPPANAISEQLVRDLNAALNSVENDDSVRAVIITGAGDRIFCAGADLASAFAGGGRRLVHPRREQRGPEDRAVRETGHRRNQRARARRRL